MDENKKKSKDLFQELKELMKLSISIDEKTKKGMLSYNKEIQKKIKEINEPYKILTFLFSEKEKFIDTISEAKINKNYGLEKENSDYIKLVLDPKIGHWQEELKLHKEEHLMKHEEIKDIASVNEKVKDTDNNTQANSNSDLIESKLKLENKDGVVKEEPDFDMDGYYTINDILRKYQISRQCLFIYRKLMPLKKSTKFGRFDRFKKKKVHEFMDKIAALKENQPELFKVNFKKP